MKRQKQIDESKEMIADAFVRLLQDYDYDDLTLSQIADEAKVNRMTLYRHFKTKEKIILYQAEKTFKEQEAQAAGQPKPFQEFIRRRLEWVQDLPQLPVLLRSREIEELLEGFSVASYRSPLEQAIGKRIEEDPYLFHFYFGGVSRIIREWLKGGCQESSRDISDRVISLTRSFVLSHRAMGHGTPSESCRSGEDLESPSVH
jgi:AcrR family transcriptional regulator